MWTPWRPPLTRVPGTQLACVRLACHGTGGWGRRAGAQKFKLFTALQVRPEVHRQYHLGRAWIPTILSRSVSPSHVSLPKQELHVTQGTEQMALLLIVPCILNPGKCCLPPCSCVRHGVCWPTWQSTHPRLSARVLGPLWEITMHKWMATSSRKAPVAEHRPL